MKEHNQETNNKKTLKIMIAIIAILAVAVIGLIIALVSSKGKKDKKEETTERQTVSDASEEQVASDTDATDILDSVPTHKDFIYVVNVNSWETDNRYYAQFDVRVSNGSDDTYRNWKLEIAVPEDTLLSDLWNGVGEVDNGVLTITPVEYNNEIAGGNELEGIGFIISTRDPDGLAKVGTSNQFYADGELIDGVGIELPAPTATEEQPEASTEEIVSNEPPKKEEGTPFANHGKLTLDGVNIVDEHGDKYQLKGLSTHGLAWFPEYVNKEAFQTFRDDWGANLIRLAMYTDENGGYCSGGDRAKLKQTVCNGVDYATDLGMYVIVDWHILHDLSPKVYEEDAKVFFEEMSKKYKDYDNIIYEICNEPNGGTTWKDVKSYAEVIIPIIRNNDPDAIIIVGTPTWSQDVDVAAQNPITGYDNIMYAVHFYAATHTDNIRNKVTTALDAGLPVFISEFSICDASGNGAIDYGQADKWFDLINSNNLSYAAWNISNKNETSSIIKASCNKTSGWTVDDLSEAGVWVRNKILGK